MGQSTVAANLMHVITTCYTIAVQVLNTDNHTYVHGEASYSCRIVIANYLYQFLTFDKIEG